MTNEPDRVEKQRPLKWATLEELLEELRTRNEAFIFVQQRETEGDANASSFNLYWHGGILAAHGLAVYAARCTVLGVKALAQEWDEDN